MGVGCVKKGPPTGASVYWSGARMCRQIVVTTFWIGARVSDILHHSGHVFYRVVHGRKLTVRPGEIVVNNL